MGTAANADAHRPRPQSASDRSTPSQVGSQSFACNLHQCCRTMTVPTCLCKHTVGMPAADLHACLMCLPYIACMPDVFALHCIQPWYALSADDLAPA